MKTVPRYITLWSGIIATLILTAASVTAKTITLDDALDIARNHTARGEMVDGNLEVAEQNYNANRINFYLPEISIKGSAPSYAVDESYRFFGGADQKQLYKTRKVNYNSFIELNQSLITGGDIIMTANLMSNDERYPNTRTGVTPGTNINEETRQGYFTISYSQPLLKPSTSKHNLKNTRDDYEIARLARIEEEMMLKKEVIEAYMGLLQASVKQEMYTDKYRSAMLKADIDSVKLDDGVISEEDLLISRSDRLDAELNRFEMETEAIELKRKLAILLDFDVEGQFNPVEPEVVAHLEETEKQYCLSSWENSVPIHKAELEYDKARRDAEYKSAGHGLTGELNCNYSTGQGTVETDGIDEDIDTRGWEISLDFTYPLWDGGSSGAEIKSAKLQAEQARLEFQREKQNTRAAIINLINQLDVSYRRLEIMRKQVELAQNRLEIARGRMEDGHISEITFLESKTDYLDARVKYLEEMETYLLNRAELDGKYLRDQ
ncbi:MAG: TolC family protein [candidate division Zixibacteria bacterium]|nr:TolC family protein [candidate division Zixibacteria bacterium]